MLERRAQLGPATMDPAAYRPELDPERIGDLFVGQTLDVTQHHGGTVLGRQVGERGSDVRIQMAVVESLRRRRLGAPQPRRRFLAEPLEPDALAPAGDVEEQVRGDAMQPALERAWRVGRQRPEHAHEDFLGQVLGVVAIAGQPIGQPVNPRRVLLDDVFPARRRPLRSRTRAGLIHHLSLHQPSLACPAKRPQVLVISLEPYLTPVADRKPSTSGPHGMFPADLG